MPLFHTRTSMTTLFMLPPEIQDIIFARLRLTHMNSYIIPMSMYMLWLLTVHYCSLSRVCKALTKGVLQSKTSFRLNDLEYVTGFLKNADKFPKLEDLRLWKSFYLPSHEEDLQGLKHKLSTRLTNLKCPFSWLPHLPHLPQLTRLTTLTDQEEVDVSELFKEEEQAIAFYATSKLTVIASVTKLAIMRPNMLSLIHLT